MFKNIFLASYPKSGNTWMRAIISNLYSFDKEFNLKTLKSIPLLSIKKNFDEFENKIYSDNNVLDFDWVSKNIIDCQKILNKKSNHLNRLVTLSPLTEMAKNFHLRNGAKLLSVNENTQNFEYK